MGLLEDILNLPAGGHLDTEETDFPHDHVDRMRTYRTSEPLPCGSEYFVVFNTSYTSGFDREQLIEFRDGLVTSINKSLALGAATAAPVTTPCLLCKAETTPDNAFQTILGWMHIDCKEVE